jgi:hypothetical protein
MLYRRCSRCALILIEPQQQRDHRCPRCLMGDGVGVEMRPTALGQGQHPDGPLEVARVLARPHPAGVAKDR